MVAYESFDYMSKFLECLCDRISVSVTGQLGSLSNYDDEDDKDNVKKQLFY